MPRVWECTIGTHESAEDGEPDLEDGHDAELACGGEDGAKGVGELVVGVGERVEGVAEAGEADDVEGGPCEPGEGIDAGAVGRCGVGLGQPDVAQLRGGLGLSA